MTAPGPSVPSGLRVYAVGDIHGEAGRLAELLRTVEADAAEAPGDRLLVTLGDYVDRGPDSREVIDILEDEPLSGFRYVHLIGNHEQMMLDFLDDPENGPRWLMNGGDATCRSYGIDPLGGHWDAGGADSSSRLDELRRGLEEALPVTHRRFLDALALHHREGDYLFVHAGLRPNRPLAVQDPEDLIWIRDPFLYSARDHGFVVVHGHTPTSEPDRQPNRIGIDTGACYGGRLSCLVLETNEQRILQA